ncbi:hypothetical protein IMZ48_38210 [Candidatus Bathyarchaeota archaeon]|nr:hypothetical protein [Candidatus Bathyarchaeota archaeon]
MELPVAVLGHELGYHRIAEFPSPGAEKWYDGMGEYRVRDARRGCALTYSYA